MPIKCIIEKNVPELGPNEDPRLIQSRQLIPKKQFEESSRPSEAIPEADNCGGASKLPDFFYFEFNLGSFRK